MSDYQENAEIGFDDLHFDTVNEDLGELATENVLASGVYPATGLNMNMFEDASDPELRQCGKIQFGLMSESGKVFRKVRLTISWQKRYAGARIDKKFRLYGKLIQALGVDTNDPREVMPTSLEVPVKLSIAEAYLAPEGGQHEMHADRSGNNGEVWCILPAPDGNNDEQVKEARLHYISKGLDPIYLVQNVFPID